MLEKASPLGFITSNQGKILRTPLFGRGLLPTQWTRILLAAAFDTIDHSFLPSTLVWH